MQLIPCEPSRHAAAIVAIFNDAVVNSTALYDYKPGCCYAGSGGHTIYRQSLRLFS